MRYQAVKTHSQKKKRFTYSELHPECELTSRFHPIFQLINARDNARLEDCTLTSAAYIWCCSTQPTGIGGASGKIEEAQRVGTPAEASILRHWCVAL